MKRSLLFLVLAIILGNGVLSQDTTYLTGVVRSDCTLYLASSPYVITDVFRVEYYSKLVIEAGVEIFFDQGARLSIGGNSTIQAVGTEQDSIYFDYRSADGTRGDWSIDIHSFSFTNTFAYCSMQNTSNKNIGHYSEMDWNIVITHSYFNNNFRAINCGQVHIFVNDCKFTNNGGCIQLGFDGGSEITKNQFYHNEWALDIGMDNNSVIKYNDFSNNDIDILLHGNAQPTFNYNNLEKPMSNWSAMDMNFRYNYWGEAATQQMATSRQLINITRIHDQFDDPNLGLVDYTYFLNAPWPAGVPYFPEPLVAGFTAQPACGTPPLMVNFFDTSTGVPISWDWDFGDGYTSTDQHPVHVYQASGSYTVRLTITSVSGCETLVKEDFIVVNPSLVCEDGFIDPRDSTIYKVAKIGLQCWMAQNLDIGEEIHGTLDQSDDQVIEKYCYENNKYNCEIFGGLYQWDEMMGYAMDEGVQGICPDGWHLPSDLEWQILEGYVDSQFGVGDPVWVQNDWRGADAGGKLKEAGYEHWWEPNTGATNESGFTALPGGFCQPYDTTHNNWWAMGYFWTSSSLGTSSQSYYRLLDHNRAEILRHDIYKGLGLAVRCIKNIPAIYVDLGPDQVSCGGESVTLNAFNEGAQYLWSTGEVTQSIVVSTDGEYSVEVNYEGYTARDTINIAFIPTDFADAGNDTTIYIGYPPYETQLNATGGVSYSWSPETGLSDPDISNPIALPDIPTLYTVTVTDANGCVSTDDVFVNVIDVRCGANNDKVEVCHVAPGNPEKCRTVCIDSNAVAQTLAHGGYLGPCNKSAFIEEDLYYEINVLPNPFRSSIHIRIQIPVTETIVIRLYSAEGKLKTTIHSDLLDEGIHHFEINTVQYPAGMYFLHVQSSLRNKFFKLIKN